MPSAKEPIRLLTNDFDHDAADIALVYMHRWQIEMHYKQLKQNFQLRYFFGDNRNAIRTQIWVTLIANLLLMYHVDPYHFLEDPEKTLIEFNKSQQNAPPRRGLFG